MLSIANRVFDKSVKDTKTEAHQKEEHFLNVIGQQNIEIDFLKKLVMNQTKVEHKTHIDKANNLSIYRQCALTEVSRSSFYYKALSETELNLTLMRLIDEEYMNHPWLAYLG